jgi:tartrate/fumarate subfamily iron-sulfur-dependent hydro-lyase beta chain
MNSSVKNFKLPLSEEEARSLKCGDMITLTGRIFTGRSRFHIRAVEDSILPPVDFSEVNCFFHVGPVMKQENGEWKIVSLEPTSSIRFERYGPEVIRKLKLRTLIGKTTMGPGTVEALREVGGVYLSKIGLCGNTIANQAKAREVYFLDELGKTEATWIFDVEEFGPFFVAIDSHGNSYFEDLNTEAESNMAAVNELIGVSDDYSYTNVDPAGK